MTMEGRVFKRILAGMIVLLSFAGLGFLVHSWRLAIETSDPPLPSSFPSELVERGRMLSGASNCAARHTVEGGGDYAGGLAIRSDFGTIYSTNITTDPDTGICDLLLRNHTSAGRRRRHAVHGERSCCHQARHRRSR
jgi:hypothetical protein